MAYVQTAVKFLDDDGGDAHRETRGEKRQVLVVNGRIGTIHVDDVQQLASAADMALLFFRTYSQYLIAWRASQCSVPRPLLLIMPVLEKSSRWIARTTRLFGRGDAGRWSNKQMPCLARLPCLFKYNAGSACCYYIPRLVALLVRLPPASPSCTDFFFFSRHLLLHSLLSSLSFSVIGERGNLLLPPSHSFVLVFLLLFALPNPTIGSPPTMKYHNRRLSNSTAPLE